MKKLRSMFAALFAGVAASGADQPKPTAQSPSEMMRELRLRWLTTTAPVESPGQKDDVLAVVMDWPLDQQIVTILASSVGDASVLTTGTFGVIGGIGHEGARKAAMSAIACAKKHIDLASPTTEFSYPDRQHIRFFIVTGAGVRSVQFGVDEVQKPDTPAFDLFAHAQAVLTEMRQITQKQRGY